MQYVNGQQEVGQPNDRKWLHHLTRSWSIRKRLLLAVLGGQALALMAGGAALAAVTLNRPGSARAAAAVWAVSFVAFEATTLLIVLAAAGRLSGRVSSLTKQVSQSNLYQELILSPGTDEQDELWQLIDRLNARLLAIYRVLGDLSRRADRMTTLNQIAATINRTFDLDEIYKTSLAEALRSTACDIGAVYLWDARVGMLNMVTFIGMDEEAVRRMYACKLGEGPVGQAAQTYQIIVANAQPASVAGGGWMPACQIALPLVAVPGEMLGVLLIVSSTTTAVSDDTLDLLVTVARQMALATDKSKLYAQVKEHAADLEDIVKARTEELAQAIDKLSEALERAQAADRVKSLLLSTVSHELRTPLATIKGNTSLLIEHHQRIGPDTLVEHLRDIEEETDKLTELISNLMEMSRIEAGVLHIEREPVDMGHVVAEAVAAARLRHGGHPLTPDTPEELPMVFGDARRLEQVVANLLDNAAKYSGPGMPITVTARASGDSLIVSVSDRGPGIAPEHLERIFERFYQVAQRGDSQRHGIGLGLAICRGLIEAHHGRIWARSVPGRGSTFSFSLPLITPEQLNSGGPGEQSNHSRR
jgi:K+-sensing histidine kinase KdpD